MFSQKSEPDQKWQWKPGQSLGVRERRLFWFTQFLELPGAALRFGCGFVVILILCCPLWYFVYQFVYAIETDGGAFSSLSSTQEALQTSMAAVFWCISVPAFLLAFGNIFLSVATGYGVKIKWLTGNLLTRFSLGARPPSQREQEQVLAALERIQSQTPKDIKVVAPLDYYIVDNPKPNAWVIGNTLYLTRELVTSPHLAAVMAHNYGHLNSPDSKLTLALRRLLLPHTYFTNPATGNQVAPGLITVGVEVDVSTVHSFLLDFAVMLVSFSLGILGGGLGLLLLNPLWIWHWRDREYYADNFAARCGFAQELIDYLEKYQFFDVATPFFMNTNPYSELRIDKLQAFLNLGQQ